MGMLSKENNETLCRVGPGTPMGGLLRRYWLPLLLSSELPEAMALPSDPPSRRVAHRLSRYGRQVGLVAENCPHRGASLFFGRNEEAGLRCVYHGWKFDTLGPCVDMPNEPPESNFKHKVKVTAYPCRERNGIVWTYLGRPGEEPPLPEIEWATLPEGQRYISKRVQECNWVQGFEGGIDSSHSPFCMPGWIRWPSAACAVPRRVPVFGRVTSIRASRRLIPKPEFSSRRAATPMTTITTGESRRS